MVLRKFLVGNWRKFSRGDLCNVALDSVGKELFMGNFHADNANGKNLKNLIFERDLFFLHCIQKTIDYFLRLI